MFIEEITRSCSNEKVVMAAVASLGASFAHRVSVAAGQNGLSAGAFAALTVRRFAHTAGEADRKAVRMAMRGADQPVLSGLRQIIELTLEGRTNRGHFAVEGKRQACC